MVQHKHAGTNNFLCINADLEKTTQQSPHHSSSHIHTFKCNASHRNACSLTEERQGSTHHITCELILATQRLHSTFLLLHSLFVNGALEWKSMLRGISHSAHNSFHRVMFSTGWAPPTVNPVTPVKLTHLSWCGHRH